MKSAKQFEDKGIELSNTKNLEILALKKNNKQQIENFVGTKKQIEEEEERLKKLSLLEINGIKDFYNEKKRDLNDKFKKYLEEREGIQNKSEQLKHKLFNLAWEYGNKDYYAVEAYYFEMSELLKSN